MATEHARHSLRALHLGDAFGEQFFAPGALELLRTRTLPEPLVWRYTDDTAEAAVLVRHLTTRGEVEPDALAMEWAEEYTRDSRRGYGAGAQLLFVSIAAGGDWRALSASAFGGTGSMGNGSAMRVAPLGAFFAEDLDRAAQQAALSAKITHANANGVAGAVATAVAAACVARGSDAATTWSAVLERTPRCLTWDVLERAADLPDATTEAQAAELLGTGERVCTFDTVPFCIWMALRHRSHLEEALWATASGLGDIDTTCAIVGGILGASLDTELPEAWLRRVEPIKG